LRLYRWLAFRHLPHAFAFHHVLIFCTLLVFIALGDVAALVGESAHSGRIPYSPSSSRCRRAGQASPSSLSTWTRPQRSRYVPLTASGRPGSAPNACIWRIVSGACAWFGAGPGHVLLRSLAVMNILPAALPLSLRRDLSVTAPPSSMTRYLSSHRGMRQGCEDAALYCGAARGPAFTSLHTRAHSKHTRVHTRERIRT